MEQCVWVLFYLFIPMFFNIVNTNIYLYHVQSFYSHWSVDFGPQLMKYLNFVVFIVYIHVKTCTMLRFYCSCLLHWNISELQSFSRINNPNRQFKLYGLFSLKVVFKFHIVYLRHTCILQVDYLDRFVVLFLDLFVGGKISCIVSLQWQKMGEIWYAVKRICVFWYLKNNTVNMKNKGTSALDPKM